MPSARPFTDADGESIEKGTHLITEHGGHLRCEKLEAHVARFSNVNNPKQEPFHMTRHALLQSAWRVRP